MGPFAVATGWRTVCSGSAAGEEADDGWGADGEGEEVEAARVQGEADTTRLSDDYLKIKSLRSGMQCKSAHRGEAPMHPLCNSYLQV